MAIELDGSKFGTNNSTTGMIEMSRSLYHRVTPLTAGSRVRGCGVLRSCVHSLCGLRALAVAHWKGGVFRLSCQIRLSMLLSCFVAELRSLARLSPLSLRNAIARRCVLVMRRFSA